MTELIVEKEDELAPLLTDEAKEILDQMSEKSWICRYQIKKAFISGFCLGARIMLETMGWTDTPKTDEKKG